MKPTRNLSGQFTRENIDIESHEDFASMFTTETSSLLSRPAIGMSYHMATLWKATEELSPCVSARILGPGISNLVTQLQKLGPRVRLSQNVCSRGGQEERTRTSGRRSPNSTIHPENAHESRLSAAHTLSMRQAGVRPQHFSQALAELMAFWCDVALKTARAIPATEPVAEHLSAATKSSSGQTAAFRLQSWLTEAYQDKLRSHGRRTASATHATHFPDITTSDGVASDPGGVRGAGVVTSCWFASIPSVPVSERPSCCVSTSSRSVTSSSSCCVSSLICVGSCFLCSCFCFCSFRCCGRFVIGID